jgi:hypothetical protein
MSEAFSISTSAHRPTPPPSKRVMTEHFWALGTVMYGSSIDGLALSKSEALKLILELEIAQHEDMAKQSMKSHREGTLTLIRATTEKAIRDGWDISPESVGKNENKIWKMAGGTFVASGASWFFREAVDEFDPTI